MIRPTVFLLSLAALVAACGADAPPQPPADEPGITISGLARIGIAGGN
ncbi:hypothetical protein [Aliigemmobacter aestuarii]|nr:hypothetical protein [Gemmobacter aestuarii]